MSEPQKVSDIMFIQAFNEVAKGIHETAKDKGWWDNERNNGEAIMLMVTELAEAVEFLRMKPWRICEVHGHVQVKDGFCVICGNVTTEMTPPDDKIPEFSGVEAELADCIVRIMDISHARGWRIAEALVAKIAFNATRERMHGGKKF